MIFRCLIGFLVFVCAISKAHSQNERLQVGGYLKFLNNSVKPYQSSLRTSQLFHNRINLDWYPANNWKMSLGIRNRIFTGADVNATRNLGQLVDQYDGLVDLSILWLDNTSAVIHTQIDRAYINWSQDKWDITLGRQRINWGVNLVWNPNDIFNAFNYFEFDYEERPGSDAIRIQYFPKLLSRIELAIAPDQQIAQSVGALLYKFNYKNYDIQFLGGYYREDIVLGTGWTGYLKGAGFKGEISYFIPVTDSPSDESSWSASITSDYQLNASMYVMGSLLYNSTVDPNLGLLNLAGARSSGTELSPKNLFPSPWSFLAQLSGQPHPLLQLSGTVIYGTENHLTAFLPAIAYSIQQNWDIDLTVQSFFIEGSDSFQHAGSAFFLRLKWSY